jgi:excisionase family DNA binding protein
MGTVPGRQRKEPVTTTVLPMFLTARQVADMLQVDERTVLRWAQHDASMPATRLGRVVRFEREPLLRWLSRKQPRFARPPRQVSMRQGPGAA